MKRQEALQEYAQQLSDQLNKEEGMTLTQLAADNGYIIQKEEGLTRFSTQNAVISATVLANLFGHEAGQYFQSIAQGPNIRIIGKVGESQIVTTSDDAQSDADNNILERQVGDDILATMLNSYQQRVGTAVNEERLNQIASGNIVN